MEAAEAKETFNFTKQVKPGITYLAPAATIMATAETIAERKATSNSALMGMICNARRQLLHTPMEAAPSDPIDLLLDPGSTTSMLPISRMEAIMTRPGCVRPTFDFSLTTGACIANLPVLKRRRYNNRHGRLMNSDWLLSLFLRLSISVQVNVSTSTAWSLMLLCDCISDTATIVHFADCFPDPDADSRPRWHDERNDIHAVLTKTMLIVTSVTLRAQWIKEIEKCALHCMNIDKLKVHGHEWWSTSGMQVRLHVCSHPYLHYQFKGSHH
ncbi:uncharacterized protein UBRO_20939 [Ustilago bromivora]|uniref:Uncharacterized protein n=1 Tax=Ustilago bromivora TaxID=307758 RepID=A0A1K0HC07_9BASI|nr:uncharacterized protein UBRO_20939 [Ustilago bromivora]